MKRAKVRYRDRLVGELLAQDGGHYFKYDEAYLNEPLPLSPYQLPPTIEVTKHKNGLFLTLPSMCHDSLPDRFGMSVMRRNFRERGIINPSPLEMLCYLGSRTMGALTYEPAYDEPDNLDSVDLVQAALSAKHLLEHEHDKELDPAIIKAGGTAGGATPKLLAAITPDGSKIVTGSNNIPEGMKAWLIKLNTEDRKAASLIQLEYAYFAMAKAAGLRVPETRLLKDKGGMEHFAIQRFDRDIDQRNERIHLQTYAAMAGIDFHEPTSDYEDLLRLTKHLTRNHEEVVEQFRRMVFNVLACNRDDHAKNFSFCMDDSGDWAVSPAYDLLYTDNDLGGNWTMVQGKRSGISRDDFRSVAKLMSISGRELKEILDQTRDAISQWKTFADASNIGPGLSTVIKTMLMDTQKAL